MRIRKLVIMMTRSLISVFIFSIIFMSITDLNINNTINNLFDDIYEFSDQQTKDKTITNLESICGYFLGKGQENNIDVTEFCKDMNKLEQIKENCNKYYEYREKKEIERNEDIEESCEKALSGEIEEACKDFEGESGINNSILGNVCEQHNNNTISDKEFFSGIMLSVVKIPEIGFERLDIKLLILPICSILIFLIVMLFVLHKGNINGLLFSLGRVIFNLGLMLIIIFSIFYLYRAFLTPNTSFILEAVTDNNGNPELMKEALPVLVPLIFARLFDMAYLMVGFVLFASGLTIKIIFKKGKI